MTLTRNKQQCSLLNLNIIILNRIIPNSNNTDNFNNNSNDSMQSFEPEISLFESMVARYTKSIEKVVHNINSTQAQNNSHRD